MNFYSALGLSVGLHAILAAVGAISLAYESSPDQLVQLDLSAVELSFAEKEQEASPAVPPVVETPPPPPPEEKKDEKKEEVEEKVEEPEPKPEPEPEPEPELLKEEAPEEPLPPSPKEEPKPEPPKPPPPPKPVEVPKPQPEPPKPLPPPPPPQPVAPPPAAPRQAAIDAPPRPRRSIKPDYPRGARARGEQGEVELEIEVGADGRVTSARVVHSSGYPELDGAALAAARAAKFVPAKSGRKAVASMARLKLHFQLK